VSGSQGLFIRSSEPRFVVFRVFYAVIRCVATLALAGMFMLVVAYLLLYHCRSVYIMMTKLNMNDFGKFYYATLAFLQGGDMYGPNPATWIPITESISKHFWNLNPPHFHLAVLPFVLFSPKAALALWGLVNLLCLIASLCLIVREVGVEITPLRFFAGLFGLLAFTGTSTVLVTGQLSFLMLLPVTLAWIEARRGRWTTTGVYLGVVISFKPFLLVFIPYLLLRRKFRAAAAACSIPTLACVIGLGIFGIDCYASWLDVLSRVDWPWAAMNGSIQGILSRTFELTPYYVPLVELPHLVKPLWLVAGGVVGILTMALAVCDSTDHAVDRAFGLLLIGSLLVSPLGWVYYIWLPLGPMGVLLRSWSLSSASGTAPAAIRTDRWKKALFLGAVLGLIFPYHAPIMLQPSALATIAVGSVYFWAILALWIWLVIDFYNARRTSLKRQVGIVVETFQGASAATGVFPAEILARSDQ